MLCCLNTCNIVFLLTFHLDGLAVGMEDVDVGDGDANGDMEEKDDAELCYEKHTGKLLLSHEQYYISYFLLFKTHLCRIHQFAIFLSLLQKAR